MPVRKICLATVLLGCCCSASFAAFTEAAAAQGVAHTAGLAQGVSFIDIDGDGDDDLSIGVHDAGVRRFLNNGSGTFTEQAAALPGTPRGGTNLWFDYDKDGDLDVFVGYAFVNSHLYRNDGGGTYVEVSNLLSATAADYTNIFTSLAGDFDKNGFADLALSPFSSSAGVNRIYSNSAGTFTSTGAGTFATTLLAPRSGNSLDFDNDGDIDIYFCGDALPSLLYRNDGGGVYTNIAAGTPIENASRAGRGSAWGDLDKDGDLDCVIANTGGSGNSIIRNDGGGTFTTVASATFDTGIANAIGTVLFDYDNDSDLDIFVHTLDDAGPAKLYRNDGISTFTDVTATDAPLFTTNTAGGRGAAVADIDNDGDLDLYRANGTATTPSYLYINGTNNNNWLKVKLTAAPTSDKQLFGARISVYDAGTSTIRGFSQIQSQTGYLSQNSFTQHFGVPSAGTYDIAVYFPKSNTTVIQTNIAATQTKTIAEPAPTAAKEWELFY